jgi:hypothetical protein
MPEQKGEYSRGDGYYFLLLHLCKSETFQLWYVCFEVSQSIPPLKNKTSKMLGKNFSTFPFTMTLLFFCDT